MTDQEMPTLHDIIAAKLEDRLPGKKVVPVMTPGGDLSIDRLRKLLTQPGKHSARASG
jgi:hypothetical protein